MGGVIGGCGELCSQLPKGVERTGCDLVCGYVGIKTFIKIIDNTDLDIIYGCTAMGACEHGPDDSDVTLVATNANPNPVTKGSTIEMQLGVNSTKGSGLGSFSVSVEGPVTSGGISDSFRLMDGVPEGEQVLGVKLQIRDQFPTDPSQFPVIWEPGTYNFTFHMCQAECGSKHPHSLDFGRITGTFELQESSVIV